MGIIESKARDYKILKGKIRELEAQAAEIESELKAEMNSRETDEMQAGAFRIAWKLISSTRFDSKKFKADHEDIYSLYSVVRQDRRFTVS